jgi:hypothetical protein
MGLAPEVVSETLRLFGAGEALDVQELLEKAHLPLLNGAEMSLERARVHMAALKRSGGSVESLRNALRIASTDWRDLLVATGLAGSDWRDVLSREGFLVPAGP